MRREIFIVAGLIVATILFRLSVLLHARDVNSDAALVGLQAMHMLRGEWSWLLWGVGYQSSIDSALTAGAFALFGASPHVLMLVPISLHVVVTLFAFAVLRKRLDLGLATVCTLPLVFAPVALTWPIVSANRQACIAILFLSIWLLDGAAESKRPTSRYLCGALCAAGLLVVDLYAVLLLPGLLALLAFCVFDGKPDRRQGMRRAVPVAVGLALGFTLFMASRSDQQATSGQARMSLARVASNASLLCDQCLPYSLGYARYHEEHLRYRGHLSSAPVLFTAGGWSLLLGILAGGALGMSKLPWSLRRLGLFGLITTLTTLAAFLVSVMPADLWSVRYLGPIFWTAPFALAPLARWLGRRGFTLAIVPWLVVSGISGWLSFRSPFTGADSVEEQHLIEYLRNHDIRIAATDYWLAYRLTFIAREDPIVVPIDPLDDRYEPFRQRFLRKSRTALIFHPRWSRQLRQQFEQSLQAQQIPYQTTNVGEFVLLIVNRSV